MKKIKLPLEMKNGVLTRSLDELLENWDLDCIYKHFISGKLFVWLHERYYEVEAEAVKNITVQNEYDIKKSLCDIFGKEFSEVVAEEIKQDNSTDVNQKDLEDENVVNETLCDSGNDNNVSEDTKNIVDNYGEEDNQDENINDLENDISEDISNCNSQDISVEDVKNENEIINENITENDSNNVKEDSKQEDKANVKQKKNKLGCLSLFFTWYLFSYILCGNWVVGVFGVEVRNFMRGICLTVGGLILIWKIYFWIKQKKAK